MKLSTLLRKLDEALVKKHDEYLQAHKAFDIYRGKEIGDDLEEINKALQNIQNLYEELHPVLHFIAWRSRFAAQLVESHSAFIDSLKGAGAKEVEN